MLSIRKAKSSDWKGIDAITKEFSDHDYDHPPEYFTQAIANKRIFIAVVANKIVGYLAYYIIWGNTPYLELLRVTANQQKKGIGSKLLNKLETTLERKGYKTLISSSEEVNVSGNLWHQKVGFQPIGQLKMIYGPENFYKKEIR